MLHVVNEALTSDGEWTDISDDRISVPAIEELLARFTSIDYVVLMLTSVSSGVFGLYWAFFDSPTTSIKQLLTAEGCLSTVAVAMSLLGSYVSAALILGLVGQVYENGTMFYATILAYSVPIAVTAKFFVPVFHNLQLVTCFQYLELRFNRTIRYLAVFFYVIQMIIYLGITLHAPALALSQVTGISQWSAVVSIGLLCTVYTSFGGIKAVVYTDCFHCAITIISLTVIVLLGLARLGGLREVLRVATTGGRLVLNDFRLDAANPHTFWAASFGAAASNTAIYATNQMMVLRFFTVSSVRKARTAVWINLPLLAVILMLASLTGLMAYAKYADCDPLAVDQITSSDQLLPYFVMDVLGTYTGVPGLFVAGIFATAFSSVSSGVNALANVVFIDVIALKWAKLSDKAGSKLIVLLGVFFGMLSIALVAIADAMGNVMRATLAINSAIGGPILGLFSAGIFVPQVTCKGALVGFIGSLLCSVWLNLGPIISGVPSNVGLPTSVSACETHYLNLTEIPVESIIEYSDDPLEGVPYLLRISSLWYTLISVTVHLVLSVAISKIGTKKFCVRNLTSTSPEQICETQREQKNKYIKQTP